MGVILKYPVSRFSTFLRIAGCGYRVLSRISHCMSLRNLRLYAMYSKASLPTDLWLGRGLPQHPYVFGAVVCLLRKELQPKDFKLVPPLCYPATLGEKTQDFLEYSLVRKWCEAWLRHVHWYWCTAMHPEVTIQQLMDAPVVSRYWYASQSDVALVKFGILWKAFDNVYECSVSGTAPKAITGSLTHELGPYVVGGDGISNFLVCAKAGLFKTPRT